MISQETVSNCLKTCNLIYGTHHMADGIKYGFKYGIIDTATGYKNAELHNEWRTR